MVLHVIKHRVYRGEIVHRGQSLPGHHEEIVSERLWQQDHKVYSEAKWRLRRYKISPLPPILKGLLFDRTGNRIHHTFMMSRGQLYRYYIASVERRRYGKGSDAYMRFRAQELETSVVEVVREAAGYAVRNRSRIEETDMVRRHVERVDIGLDDMRIKFRTGAQVSAQHGGRLGSRRTGAVERCPIDRWTPEKRVAQAEVMRARHKDPSFAAATVQRVHRLNESRRDPGRNT